MSEDRFRVCVIVLFAILVVGILLIGHRFAGNGRYQPFDFRTQHSPDGKRNYSPDRFEMLDTRTGDVIQKKR
jgi:hypothetical protein